MSVACGFGTPHRLTAAPTAASATTRAGPYLWFFGASTRLLVNFGASPPAETRAHGSFGHRAHWYEQRGVAGAVVQLEQLLEK